MNGIRTGDIFLHPSPASRPMRGFRPLALTLTVLGLGALGWLLLASDGGIQTREALMQVTKPSDQEIVLTQTFAAPRGR